jgi:hypothetical protein
VPHNRGNEKKIAASSARLHSRWLRGTILSDKPMLIAGTHHVADLLAALAAMRARR